MSLGKGRIQFTAQLGIGAIWGLGTMSALPNHLLHSLVDNRVQKHYKRGDWKLMPKFSILGEHPPLGPTDTIQIIDEVRRHDIVAFSSVVPGEYHIRVVRPSEFPTFDGAMYQIDVSAEDKGGFLLRQVRMEFWPWKTS